MISNIVLLQDLLRGTRTFPDAFFDLIREPIRQGCGIDIGFPPGGRRPHGLRPDFDLEIFRALATENGQHAWNEIYHRLPEPARDYLVKHLPETDLLISFEMPPWLIGLCETAGIPFLDLRVSPLRFGRDLYIALRTSVPALRQRLSELAVTEEELRLEAAHLAANISLQQRRLEEAQRHDFQWEANCAVFVGQAPYDASLIGSDGGALRCEDFAERIRQITKGRPLQHKAHPFAIEFSEHERTVLSEITGQPVKPCLQNAYQILSAEEDIQLIGISSGLLQEAMWFGKTAHTLFKPFVPLAYQDDTDVRAYQQVHYHTWISPGFWHQLLTPERPAPRLLQMTALPHNLARETLDQWWDYSKVLTWERTLPYEGFIRAGGGLLRQRLDALEHALQNSNPLQKPNAPEDPIRSDLAAHSVHHHATNGLSYIRPERLDIAVKTRFLRSLLCNRFTAEAEALYRKHILLRNQGIETNTAFGQVPKQGVDDYVQSCKALWKSMATKGFDPRHPIPIGNNGLPLGGAHRLSGCAVLGIQPVIRQYDTPGYRWDMSWFEQHGFSKQERLQILHEFVQLTPGQTSIFILWPHLMDKWDDAMKQLSASGLAVVGHVDLAWPEAQRAGYESLIYDIYASGLRDFVNGLSAIGRKLEWLQEKPCFIRVGVCMSTSTSAHYSTVDLAKKRLREAYHAIAPRQRYISGHFCSNAEETRHLANTVLNPHNLAAATMRSNAAPRPLFLGWMNHYRALLQQHNIAPEDACIVGSAVLEVLGIRQATDIDFTVKRDIRDRLFGDKVIRFSNGIDLVSVGYHRTTTGTQWSDDALIEAPELHFYFRGLKFAAPHILRDRKSFSARAKDLLDVELLDQKLAQAGAQTT